MKVVQTSKVTGLGRVYLGKEVMQAIGVEDGDHIQFYRDPKGRIFIDKVRAPGET